ncbi:MAG: bifunctional methylenetetrahydrofolate dehydrogenase/methenyltetrahydrofolate cyclohydrolase FolD [Paracoccaceae bacterium]|nr:bifunctional methylenetetrahydrofolate dehydrogenase/methenyltetrahydrofolate cyclohydrolase FolD [Paracoccaceae bacterium]
MQNIIDGKAFATELKGKVTAYVKTLKIDHAIIPGLAVVIVGDDPASHVYVRSKGKQTIEVGMKSVEHRLDEDTTEKDLLSLVTNLNADDTIHGILVQLPLPNHLNEDLIINSINPSKDVDGFHISNVGLLATGQKAMVPCTPLGCLKLLLKHYNGNLSGLNAVVVGRSNIVGKPMAQLLLNQSCTVTIAHSRTKNLKDVTSQADIVVAAVGRPGMISGDWIKKGATVIDVGINRVLLEDGKSKIVGDVDFLSVSQVAGGLTPVPGGVGPMTISCLLANTAIACARINGLDDPDGLAY